MSRITILALSTLILAPLTALPAADRPAPPVKLILDTDMSGDADDAGTLAMLHALADRGECELLATVVNRKDKTNASAGAVDAINTWYGRADTPIGTDKVGPTSRQRTSRYAAALREGFPNDIGPDDHAPDALDVYRRVLTAQPDRSVTICSVGALSNLAELWRREPELVRAKVRCVVVMGGRFPPIDKRETNIATHEEAARLVAAEWPTEIAWQGFEVGNPVITGEALKRTPLGNPVRRAFELRMYGGRPSIEGGQPSYDQAAAYYAVRGRNPELWAEKRGGRVVIDEKGLSRWVGEEGGRHLIVRRVCAPGLLASRIEALMVAPPKNQTSGGDLSPVQVAAAGEVLKRIEISDDWRIKSIAPRAELEAAFLSEAGQAMEKQDWLPTGVMPATVHDILLRHGKIEAPWEPGGTEKCFWVGERDWLYAVRFPIADPGLEAWLRFQGLAHKVDLYLNGERLASHADQLSLAVDVTGRLRANNTLVLHFHSAPPTRKAGSPEPGRRRKAGSYLGPNPAISTVGVFDKVFVEVSDGHRMTELVTDVSLDEALTGGTVRVDAAGSSHLASVDVRVRLVDPEGRLVGESMTPAAVKDGEFTAHCGLSVEGPRLWWPRGYGDQPLYHAEVSLLADGRVQQTERRTVGFRRVTMPEPLHFVVNGVPVFLRGGAWVTPNLMSDVWDQAREERLFEMAENAHFNAFRIWGQVEAPQDEFYEMADAKGFLIWQDFTRLPIKSDSRSIAACTSKATGLVKRLKHHPSILCWCGCNEAAQWAHEDYNKDFADRGPWKGLPAAEAVGAVCRELDPGRYYQPSSPYFGMNPNDPREGNTHGYTNMWFVPGYDYLNFASEDTRIAAPPLHSLERFMAPEDLWPEGYSTLYLPGNRHPFPTTWLPYTCAESWKKTGPVEEFYDATDAAGLVYRLGMAESLYYQDTVERQRRGRPASEESDRRACGGYIVWKYNDSWPQVYSAKVDYFLEPYHAYYALRRAYAPVMLSFDIDTFLYLWAINDTREPVTGTVRIQLYHLERNEFRKEIVREITVPPGRSSVVVRLDQAGIRAFRKEHILFATLTDSSGQVLARANAFADIERRLHFPEAKLDVEVRDGALVVRTDKFARCVTLEGDANGDPFGWFFEDNYFDLLPGEEKEVRILGDHPAGRITAKAFYSPHASTLEWKSLP